jgi:hypothetical protein
MIYYTLRGHTPVPTSDLNGIEELFKCPQQRIVGKTKIGKYEVSTVFLAIDHNFCGRGLPLLFETMIFGPDDNLSGYQERYATWEGAEAGHLRAIKKVRKETAWTFNRLITVLMTPWTSLLTLFKKAKRG